MATVSEPLRMSNIFAVLGATRFSECVRGNKTPNLAANQAVSTTTAGLRMSQFHGVTTDNPLPPAPSLNDQSFQDSVQSNGDWASAACQFEYRPDGKIWLVTDNSGTSAVQTWLPAGRSVSEYQFRVSVNGGVTWGVWNPANDTRALVGINANTDGFNSDFGDVTALVQVGAGGTVLGRTATFYAAASAQGRG